MTAYLGRTGGPIALALWLPLLLLGCDRDGAARPIETRAEAVDGAALYAQRCASCHGETGGGDGPAGSAVDASNLTTTDVQQRLSDEAIGQVIRFGRGRMPPSGIEDDAHIEAITEHVRSLAR